MTYKEQQAAFVAIKSLYRNEPQDSHVSIEIVAKMLPKIAQAANNAQATNSLKKALAEYFFFDCFNFVIASTKQDIDTLFDALESILIKKGNDYANKNRLSNFERSANLLSQSPEQSCLSLIATKIARAEQLIATGKTPENESLADTIIDLCGYTFLLYCIIIDKP